MPSRSIAVTSNVLTPSSASRTSASSTGTPDAPGTQPCPIAKPSRTSSATAIALAAEARDEATREGWVAERGRPDDRPGRARGEHRLDGCLVAQATGDLDERPLPHPARDRRDEADLAAGRVARSIEVDDVQPAGARRDKARGNGDRVVAVGGLGREVAAQEPDDPTAPKVDRREARRMARGRLRSTMAPW